MIVYDKTIERILNSGEAIEVNDKLFTLEKNKRGSCDGCYFDNKKCPQKAVTICCSNGGIVLKEKK